MISIVVRQRGCWWTEAYSGSGHLIGESWSPTRVAASLTARDWARLYGVPGFFLIRRHKTKEGRYG